MIRRMIKNLHIISDIHLEFRKRKFTFHPTRNTVLCLLGDICPFISVRYLEELLKDAKKNYKEVIYVPGNHEFYNVEGYSYSTLLKTWEAKCKQLNIHFLHNKTVTIETVNGPLRFIGTTLWSEKANKNRMNDYKRIWLTSGRFRETINKTHTQTWHKDAIEFIQHEIRKDSETSSVVLTHHAPLLEGTSDPKYKKNHEGFATDLSHLFHPCMKIWAFGHTHFPCDFEHKGVRVVSNPVGYPWELTESFPLEIQL